MSSGRMLSADRSGERLYDFVDELSGEI